ETRLVDLVWSAALKQKDNKDEVCCRIFLSDIPGEISTNFDQPSNFGESDIDAVRGQIFKGMRPVGYDDTNAYLGADIWGYEYADKTDGYIAVNRRGIFNTVLKVCNQVNALTYCKCQSYDQNQC
ncbi:MAG: hypothetical protein ACTSPB_23900, partial [Candidatus Thorarchaeota archaeon]